MTTSLEGLDLDALDRHLRSVGIPRTGELRADLISGGRSNLTFLVFDDASKWVLYRPPLHGLTPSAHDMAREYKVVAALQDTPVPVARAVTMRNDDSVLGAPFQMVEYVAGRVVRHDDELEKLGDKALISDCVDALIRVLADLHAIDPDAVGLGDFGKPTGYLERQVRRWGGQWELVRRENDPSDADVKRLYSALAEAIPPQSRSSIVHGDYRIDNTILDSQDATNVVAALDGKSSTLGDPLSDAALMCVYAPPDVQHHPCGLGLGIAADAGGRRARESVYPQAAGQSLGQLGTSIWRLVISRCQSSPRASHFGRGWAAVSPRTPTWWIRRWVR